MAKDMIMTGLRGHDEYPYPPQSDNYGMQLVKTISGSLITLYDEIEIEPGSMQLIRLNSNFVENVDEIMNGENIQIFYHTDEGSGNLDFELHYGVVLPNPNTGWSNTSSLVCSVSGDRSTGTQKVKRDEYGDLREVFPLISRGTFGQFRLYNKSSNTVKYTLYMIVG